MSDPNKTIHLPSAPRLQACKRAIEQRDGEWDRLDRAFCYTALEARQAGYRFADISRATGLSIEGVRRVVQRGAAMRALELAAAADEVADGLDPRSAA